MKNNILVAKSSINLDELEHRKCLGFKYMELQLLGDFAKASINLDTYFNIVKSVSNIDVLNIHMPLIPGIEDGNINISTFDNDRNLTMFYNCCNLANMLGNYYNHSISVVVHNDFTMTQYKNMPTIYNKVRTAIYYVLKHYENVNITIENVIPLTFLNKGITYTSSGFLFENVELAETFNERVYTTLDICHALTTIRTLEICKKIDKGITKELTLEDFFIKNSKYCNNIHLSNVRNLGVQVGTHGDAFNLESKEDMQLLKEILKLYEKYTQNALLTLEICDRCYTNCINLENTVKSLNSLGYYQKA